MHYVLTTSRPAWHTSCDTDEIVHITAQNLTSNSFKNQYCIKTLSRINDLGRLRKHRNKQGVRLDASAGAIADAGVCNHSIYKPFKHTPHPSSVRLIYSDRAGFKLSAASALKFRL
ncbi:hypothetical protein EVAR_13108_1 [Eumeta japonica]|uniref:Uncharacterized protein n=1 Tax=Eumeta variegata TaxID=151549 RepID=A0A4C1U9U1_EUMVA|nr:hypothetical protein EVAR_13108_1 [Eumeta japonica]